MGSVKYQKQFIDFYVFYDDANILHFCYNPYKFSNYTMFNTQWYAKQKRVVKSGPKQRIVRKVKNYANSTPLTICSNSFSVDDFANLFTNFITHCSFKCDDKIWVMDWHISYTPNFYITDRLDAWDVSLYTDQCCLVEHLWISQVEQFFNRVIPLKILLTIK